LTIALVMLLPVNFIFFLDKIVHCSCCIVIVIILSDTNTTEFDIMLIVEAAIFCHFGISS